MTRVDGRKPDEIRKVNIVRNFIPYAEGSVLFELGDTRVVCTASIEEKVPSFLKDTGQGWVTAEYSMLPRATEIRTPRESTMGRVAGRTQEIQRMIGRSLRSVVDLKALGELTIWIDCDVIQADGGTRTAAITGSFIALYDALYFLLKQKRISEIPLSEYVAATSVGIVDGELRLDLCFQEDAGAQVDMNVVMTDTGKIIEIQGTAERYPFTRKEFQQLLDLAEKGIRELIKIQKSLIGVEFSKDV
ncbi:MAG: ribonuclease PH [Actinomycetota bacterium]|nr:ribonuclease PH [Actinomycetota bacterium]